MRLGRRQLDVLQGAQLGRSTAWHVWQGRMAVSGIRDVYGDDVLDRLLDLELIRLEDRPSGRGFDVRLTDHGRAVLAEDAP